MAKSDPTLVAVLVSEQDKYRAALGLHVANVWMRCLFAFKLGMDDLPQGVAFFSVVEVDRVLRKEVDTTCETPSHPWVIPPGESLDIEQTLERSGGSLWRDGRPISLETSKVEGNEEEMQGYQQPDCLVHRAKSAAFLRAWQVTNEFAEVRHLTTQVRPRTTTEGVEGREKTRRSRGRAGRGQGEVNVDSDEWMAMQEMMNSGKR